MDFMKWVNRCYALWVIDYFSRFVFGTITSNRSVSKIAAYLNTVFEKFPFNTLQSDNAREFTSTSIKNWCKKFNVAQKCGFLTYIKRMDVLKG